MSDAPKFDPSKISDEVADMQERAKVCNDLMGGTEAMRKAGITYLPQEPAETSDAWQARLAKTVLLPAFEKAVSSMVGKPFGQEITIGDDVPARVKDCLENVDMAGRDFDSFARDVFEQTIPDGIGWIISDYPRVEAGATLADEREMNVRPYLIHVPLSNVCGWRFQIQNGVHVLTQFRYRECLEVEAGLFDTKKLERIRVWNRVGSVVSVQVWEQNDKKEWLPVSDDLVTIGEIPVTTVYTGRKGFLRAKPPLAGLAWLNVEHWQSRSDQRHILHFARVPMLFGKDLVEDTSGKVIVGPNRLIKGGPDSDLKVVEHTGAAISAGRTDLMDIEEAMQRVAGEVVARVSGAKTATESNQESSDGESQLRKWIMTFEDALEEALRFMALWIGEKDGGEISIAQDWDDDELAADMLTALSNLQAKGQMSLRSLAYILNENGLHEPGWTLEAELAEIEKEGPQPMTGFAPFKAAPKMPPQMGPDGKPLVA